MFSGAKFPGPIITYSLEFTWITAKVSDKQNKRNGLCPTEMLLVKLIMFIQPDRNIK